MQPKLLIVEDDPVLQDVWRTIFSTRGWDVAQASTVAEGMAQLDPIPDYLILDLQLPDGGGEAILRRVRERGLKTRVAVTTGDDDANRLAGLGAAALFRKPVDVADIWREAVFADAG